MNHLFLIMIAIAIFLVGIRTEAKSILEDINLPTADSIEMALSAPIAEAPFILPRFDLPGLLRIKPAENLGPKGTGQQAEFHAGFRPGRGEGVHYSPSSATSFPAEGPLRKALYYAFWGYPTNSFSELETARTLQQSYRRQYQDKYWTTSEKHDYAVYLVYKSILLHAAGRKDEGSKTFNEVIEEFSAETVRTLEVAGPPDRASALSLWLLSTWDLGPIARSIGSISDERAKRELLLEALAFRTMVPKYDGVRATLEDLAIKSGDVRLIMWAVRQHGDCTSQEALLDALGKAVTQNIIPIRTRSPKVGEVASTIRPLLLSWRDRYCSRQLPTAYIDLSIAWARSFNRLKAMTIDGLAESSAMGYAATIMVEVGADLRSGTRVSASFGLPHAPEFGYTLMPWAYLGFAGTGNEAIATLLRMHNANSASVLSRKAGIPIASIGLGAAFGNQYSIFAGGRHVLESAPLAQNQPCGVPVFSVDRLYRLETLAKLVAPDPKQECSVAAISLRRTAEELDVAFATERARQCEVLQLYRVSDRMSRIATEAILDMKEISEDMIADIPNDLHSILLDFFAGESDWKPAIAAMKAVDSVGQLQRYFSAMNASFRIIAASQAFSLSKDADSKLYGAISRSSSASAERENRMNALGTAQANFVSRCLR